MLCCFCSTPFFAYNSAYDTWQLDNILGLFCRPPTCGQPEQQEEGAELQEDGTRRARDRRLIRGVHLGDGIETADRPGETDQVGEQDRGERDPQPVHDRRADADAQQDHAQHEGERVAKRADKGRGCAAADRYGRHGVPTAGRQVDRPPRREARQDAP